MAHYDSFPIYIHRRKVRAAVIATCSTPSTDGSVSITFEGDLPPTRMDGDTVKRCGPGKGLYYVVTDAGVASVVTPAEFAREYQDHDAPRTKGEVDGLYEALANYHDYQAACWSGHDDIDGMADWHNERATHLRDLRKG